MVLVATVAVVVALDLDVIFWRQCDTVGSACCGPDGEVKTKHCHKGLGCDIVTGQCAACGGPGQPCCDGHFTGFSLLGYTGILLDSSERIDSCDPGARCDARLAPDGKSWIGTRTCQACGTREGGSCCAADVRYALGRCFADAVSGIRLACNDPWAREAGTCVRCGEQAGDPVCLGGFPCADGLVDEDGICVFCGFPGQPTCDRGEPCRGGQSVPNRTHSKCVAAGGANQPCLPGGRCGYAGMFCNARQICEPCGGGGETCCPPTQGAPCQVGECRESRCFACGYQNMPVCQGGEPCRDGSEPVDGFCRPCGGDGQRCCYGLSIRCEDGMPCRDGTCRRPGGGTAGGEEWKTCSGQPYTWSTLPRQVAIETADGCVVTTTYLASSPEEALECARGQHGEAVIDGPLEQVTVSIDCPHGGCSNATFYGRDEDAAKSCAEASAPVGCTVSDEPCP
jgi:hypothetical protein